MPTEDHPRVCGEHIIAPVAAALAAGSSPRMRGTLAVRDRAPMVEGIIPAYAGNTPFFSGFDEIPGDHPRVCGEHTDSAGRSGASTGSSPRMRGTRDNRHRRWYWLGIIPAYAGNTRLSDLMKVREGDHPRVCGEHIDSENRVMFNPGSSPRMRGTRGLSLSATADFRIIPAYAGNTIPLRRFSRLDRDHPRVCGEHRTRSHASLYEAGSSPRMRGTRLVKNTGTRAAGIIPAYAGNTQNHFPQ